MLPPGPWKTRFHSGDMAHIHTIVAAGGVRNGIASSRAAIFAAFHATPIDHLRERFLTTRPLRSHLTIVVRLEALEDGSPSTVFR